MKKHEYEVVMKGCTKNVLAFGTDEAIAIAKDEAIKKSFDCKVLCVHDLTIFRKSMIDEIN